MPAKAPDIRDLQYGAAWQLTLHRQIVLLHIGPNGVGGDREQAEGKLKPTATNLAIPREIELIGRLHHWRGAFQYLGVALVAVRMLEEDAVAAANGGLAVSEEI